MRTARTSRRSGLDRSDRRRCHPHDLHRGVELDQPGPVAVRRVRQRGRGARHQQQRSGGDSQPAYEVRSHGFLLKVLLRGTVRGAVARRSQAGRTGRWYGGVVLVRVLGQSRIAEAARRTAPTLVAGLGPWSVGCWLRSPSGGRPRCPSTRWARRCGAAMSPPRCARRSRTTSSAAGPARPLGGRDRRERLPARSRRRVGHRALRGRRARWRSDRPARWRVDAAAGLVRRRPPRRAGRLAASRRSAGQLDELWRSGVEARWEAALAEGPARPRSPARSAGGRRALRERRWALLLTATSGRGAGPTAGPSSAPSTPWRSRSGCHPAPSWSRPTSPCCTTSPDHRRRRPGAARPDPLPIGPAAGGGPGGHRAGAIAGRCRTQS